MATEKDIAEKEISDLIEILKEARDTLVLCSLIDKSNTCDKMVFKIDTKLGAIRINEKINRINDGN